MRDYFSVDNDRIFYLIYRPFDAMLTTIENSAWCRARQARGQFDSDFLENLQ